MIADVITFLLVAMAVSVIVQPNLPRFYAAAVFVYFTLVHEFLFSNHDGLSYYVSAALLDLAVIILLSMVRPVTDFVISLHRICLTSIFVNLMGWLLWFFYMPPTLYDGAFAMLYGWALITLIKRNKQDVDGGVGFYSTGGWRFSLSSHFRAWRVHGNKHYSET